MIVRADALRLPFRDRAFDLVIGSPPYIDARLYLEGGRNLGISRNLRDWVAWMLAVTAESLRVSKGLVVWVCAGVTRDRTYQPGPEALLADWVRAGGSAYRPVYWHRVGIPGSGHDDWFRADMEYCLAFKRPGRLPWADNVANGKPPKYTSNGPVSHRTKGGERINATGEGNWKRGRRSNGVGCGVEPSWHSNSAIILPEIANPGNLIDASVGGGHLGSPLAHENDAPYPEKIPAWFIRSHCPPAGLVFDPFSGSGTTAAAALSEGRRYLASDLRQSQCELTRRRVATVTPSLPFGAFS
jgi:site-specific DNA-methyltransferase (adenine-specific)